MIFCSFSLFITFLSYRCVLQFYSCTLITSLFVFGECHPCSSILFTFSHPYPHCQLQVRQSSSLMPSKPAHVPDMLSRVLFDDLSLSVYCTPQNHFKVTIFLEFQSPAPANMNTVTKYSFLPVCTSS